MMPLENILLKHLDRTTTLEEDLQVEQWLSASPKNRKYLQELLIVHFESNHLKKHIDVDVDAEWNIFLSKQSKPHKPIEKSISRRKIFYYVAAASLVFLLCFQFLFNTSSPMLLTESGNKTMVIDLPDLSKVTLYPQSSIEHLKDFTDLNERKIVLKGAATFDVVSNPKQPFIVDTDNFATQVLGTVFKISSAGDINSVEVYEGVVRISGKKENKESIILKQGQSVKIEGNTFSEILSDKKPIPQKPKRKELKKNNDAVVAPLKTDAVQTTPEIIPVPIPEKTAKPEVKLSKFTLKDVFNFLNDHHSEKEKFSKSRKCKPKKEDTISLNLQEDLATILKRIEVEYTIEYEKAKCDDCIRIKTIKKK